MPELASPATVRPVLSVLLIAVLAFAGTVGAEAESLHADALLDAGCPVALMDLMPGDAAVPAHLPLVESCPGIRPGARQSNGCTLNFVFRDEANLYIGTAGHCTSGLGQRIGAQGMGQFGTVVYRMSEGVGHDFALIRIDPDRVAEVEPTMCAWGGPASTDPLTVPGQHIHMYGWGVATNDDALTRSRTGVLVASSATSIQFLGLASGGDSGSPTTGMFDDALGINTHVLLSTQGSPVVYGTSIARILGMTALAGFDLEIVPGGPGGLP